MGNSCGCCQDPGNNAASYDPLKPDENQLASIAPQTSKEEPEPEIAPSIEPARPNVEENQPSPAANDAEAVQSLPDAAASKRIMAKAVVDSKNGLVGRRVVLARREDTNQHIKFKNAAALSSKQSNVELTLAWPNNAGESLALVALSANREIAKGAISVGFLGIGPAKDALRVSYDGTYLKRDDEHVLITHDFMTRPNRVLHAAKWKSKKDTFQPKGRSWKINDDGTISPAADSQLVLGVQLQSFCRGTPAVVTSGPYSGCTCTVGVGPDKDGCYEVALDFSGEVQEPVMLDASTIKVNVELIGKPFAKLPGWGQARPLAINDELGILAQPQQDWQIQQLSKLRAFVARTEQQAPSWKGDVVSIDHEGLGPDKDSDFHCKLFFPGGRKCKAKMRQTKWPMGALCATRIYSPPEGMQAVPFVNMITNVHKFSRNDGLVNVRLKYPLLNEIDSIFSWAVFDCFDEPEGAIVLILEPVEKDATTFRGFPIPPVDKDCVRDYKETPDDMTVAVGKPSSKHGHVDWALYSELNLPFPRWVLPTAFLKLVFKTIINFAITEAGDTLKVGSSGRLPDDFDLDGRVNNDTENYYAMLRPRFARGEAASQK